MMKRGTSEGIVRNGGSGARKLEQLMGFAYHLVLVDELLAGWRLQEIEAAILAAAALAAYGWNDELHGVDAQRIARKLLYPAYEMRLEDVLAVLVLGLVNHRIGEYNHIATPEIFAVNPVHYHPVSCLQLGRKPTLRHREDSEDIGAHCPSQEQRQHQCYQEFDGSLQFLFLISFFLLNIVYESEEAIPTDAREARMIWAVAPPDEDRLAHDVILRHETPVAAVG